MKTGKFSSSTLEHLSQCVVIFLSAVFVMYAFANVRTYATKVARIFGYAIYVGCAAHCVMEYIGDFVIVNSFS